ncbi:hypothetical protein [Streptomyces sp. RG80]|uniref:DUF7691 family protein n=1 Tax=Streptomyces sp. RG80 TaxID=3157340 RepID=UPI003390482A
MGITSRNISEALDHLIAGRADSDAECAGHAYYSALQKIIDCNGSEPYQVGTFSKPSTFFGLMDDELRRLGVPADLLPGDFLFAGPPEGIPFHIPYPVDGTPGSWSSSTASGGPRSRSTGTARTRSSSRSRAERP